MRLINADDVKAIVCESVTSPAIQKRMIWSIENLVGCEATVDQQVDMHREQMQRSSEARQRKEIK